MTLCQIISCYRYIKLHHATDKLRHYILNYIMLYDRVLHSLCYIKSYFISYHITYFYIIA